MPEHRNDTWETPFRTAPVSSVRPKPDTAVPLRAASLNLQGAGGRWNPFVAPFATRAPAIAKHIATRGLDVVGFQEACLTSGGPSSLEQLLHPLEALGARYQSLFVTTHEVRTRHQEGLALITRHPILGTGHFALGSSPDFHPRACLWALLDTPLGRLLFAVTHLTFQWTPQGTRSRHREVETLRRTLPGLLAQADFLLLAGDFNALPGSRTHALLSEVDGGERGFLDVLAGFDARPTFPSPAPLFRYDYLYLERSSARAHGIVATGGRRFLRENEDGLCLSDHAGVELEMTRTEPLPLFSLPRTAASALQETAARTRPVSAPGKSRHQ